MYVCLTPHLAHRLPADNWPEDAQGRGVPPGRPDPCPPFGCAETRGANDPGGQGAPVPRPLLWQQENLVSAPGPFVFTYCIVTNHSLSLSHLCLFSLTFCLFCQNNEYSKRHNASKIGLCCYWMCAHLCGSSSKEAAALLVLKTTEHLAEIGQTWFLRIEEEAKNRLCFRSTCAAQSHMFTFKLEKKCVRNMMTAASVTLYRLQDPLRGHSKLLSSAFSQEFNNRKSFIFPQVKK